MDLAEERLRVLGYIADGKMSVEQGMLALDKFQDAMCGRRRSASALEIPKSNTGKVRGYIRVSTMEQARTGLSLQAQEQTIRNYFAFLSSMPTKCHLTWGGLYTEEGESAFSIPLTRRTAGRKLNLDLCAGDEVVFVRLDRAFRNAYDALGTYENWKKRGINIHFLDLGVDMSTANGVLCLTIMAAMAEWESSMKSERVRHAAKLRKERNGVMNSRPARFHQFNGHGKYRKNVPSHDEVRQAKLIAYLYARGMSCIKISDALERRAARRENRKYRTEAMRPGTDSIGPDKCQKLLNHWYAHGVVMEMKIRHDDPVKEYRMDDGRVFEVRPISERALQMPTHNPHLLPESRSAKKQRKRARLIAAWGLAQSLQS